MSRFLKLDLYILIELVPLIRNACKDRIKCEKREEKIVFLQFYEGRVSSLYLRGCSLSLVPPVTNRGTPSGCGVCGAVCGGVLAISLSPGVLAVARTLGY